MKVGTDGVLLGVWTSLENNPFSILDIGTGTGILALMMAQKFPDAKIFSITTGLAVMKMNTDLGYKPVPFSELTDDPTFWDGCQTCKNFDVLTRTERKMCLCTGMLFDSKAKDINEKKQVKSKVFQRLKHIKETMFLKKDKK